MLKEPVSNDPNNPLISVLIYDYYGKYLRHCLDSIIHQNVLDNIEVILVDTASVDGVWDIAVEYATRYPGLMTLKRNGHIRETRDTLHLAKVEVAPNSRFFECSRLAHGKYVVTLRRDEAFLPDYVKQCVSAMERDAFACFSNVRPRTNVSPAWPNVDGRPLVNVLIHNYNYGRYLRQCLDSVFNQTYDNIGVIFSDNCSTDESWDIALEFARRYPGEMTIIRNRKNFGPATNLRNCYACIEGKYFCILCSDDAMHPDFISRCVNALESNPDSAFAMTHRAIIDEYGTPTEEPPFYNRSCIIPGPEQAAVYMMAAVNPSISQVMYNRAKAFSHLPGDGITSRWFAQRLLDFDLCCNHSMAYIKEPLLIHRIHSASDSSSISGNLMEAFGQFMLPHQFVEMASRKENMEKSINRLPEALAKLSRLCLRYCTNALAAGDETCGRRYFHLSAAIMPEIYEDPTFRQLQQYWVADQVEKERIVAGLTATANLTTRTVSYDPPPGSVDIEA